MQITMQQFVDWFNALSTEAQIQLAGLTLGMVTIIVGWIQLRLLRKQLVHEHGKSRSERALSYFASHIPEIRQKKSKLEAAIPWKGDPTAAPTLTTQQLNKLFTARPALEDDVIAVLGHWESMALTIAADFTEEMLVFEMVAGSVVKWVRIFRTYIDEQRKTVNPRLYVYLVPLADRWKVLLEKERKEKTPYFYRKRRK